MSDETTTATSEAEAATKPKRRRPGRQTVVNDQVRVVDQAAIGEIALDPDIQPRERISDAIIDEYAEAMTLGSPFPPVVLFRDPATGRLVAADGWHRIEAARKAGLATILAEIRDGGKRDAILYSVSANATHGIRRTDDDKRRAVIRLLTDPEWKQWSASMIAEKAGVTQPFVSGLRKQVQGKDAPTTVKTAAGTLMRVDGMPGKAPGRARKEPLPPVGEAAYAPDGAFDEDANGHGGVDALAVLDAAVAAGDAAAEDDSPEAVARDWAYNLVQLSRIDPVAVLGAMTEADRLAVVDAWDGIAEAIEGLLRVLEERGYGAQLRAAAARQSADEPAEALRAGDVFDEDDEDDEAAIADAIN